MPYGNDNRGFVRFSLPSKYALTSAESLFIDDNGTKYIHRFITDSDGSSHKLALPVPPREESLKPVTYLPDNPNTYSKRPFSRYSVEVTLSGGAKFYAYGINVFADTSVIVRLSKNTLLIPPPALWFASEVDNGAKQAFNSIIPRTNITMPTTLQLRPVSKAETKSAETTVAKTDYAATVLSEVAYPTWNRCALNVLSILLNSLLLNRLYSGGYRYLPYRMPWDGIYFSPHYPLFDTIADSALETANLYASDKTDTPIRCDGLFSDQNKIWQIVSLSERGLSPIEIIRKLYGDDSRIMEAKEDAVASSVTYPSFYKSIQKPRINKTANIKQNPRSAPKNSTIRVSGISALNLQNCLNVVSKYIACVPHAGYGGTLGDDARKSISGLQKFLGLEVTGEADEKTREALFKLKKSIDNGSFFDYPGFVLKFGCCGREVKRLKNMLAVLARKIPGTAPKNCDEIFDSSTELALIRAQRALGCLPTGKANRATWEKIAEEIQKN